MNEKTENLYHYIINHSSEMTEEWYALQRNVEGSEYSASVSPSVKKKVKSQINHYFLLISNSLSQSEEEMIQSVNQWTYETSSDRINSITPLSESIYTLGTLRKIYWDYMKRYINETEMEITVDDIFSWQEKIDKVIDYISESYTNHYMRLLLKKLKQQNELINDLSSPIITLTKNIGLLPLIGEIDSGRSASLLDSALQKSVNACISTLIIDLSGVYVVDTMVAQQIFQLIKSLKLVGIASILTGLRPEIAQTAINLGINFSGIRTESTLEKAFSSLEIKITDK